MNRAKVYSDLGAMLGTGAGFGVGYGVGLLGELGGGDAVVLYLLILFIVAGLYQLITKSYVPELIFFFIILPYYIVATVYGIECEGGIGDKFLLSIPFAALGTINGYWIGGSIGEKVDEREQEKRLYQQKIDAYRRKLRQWDAEGYKVEELKKKWRFK